MSARLSRGRSVRFNLYKYKSVVVLYLYHVLFKQIQFVENSTCESWYTEASHWYSIHFHTLPASHLYRWFTFHLLCLLFLFFYFLHVCQVPSLNPILFFFVCLFSPPHCPLPPSHPHEQPVKVKRKKSFNLSRKFPFYKSKENIVQELESEREYQLCDGGGGGVVFSSFPLHASVLSLQFSSFRSPPGMVCVMAPLSSLSHCPREMPPHAEPASSWRCGGGLLSLWRVCTSVSGLQRSVGLCALPAVCVRACKLLAALTHRPSNTVMLLLV